MDRKDDRPAFDDVAEFVRGWARIPAKMRITPYTQFERDLGITGDDGVELLEAAQERFKVNFKDGDGSIRTIFDLRPNEYLFNPEGSFLLGSGLTRIITLFSSPNTDPSIRPFTVGELSEAIRKSPKIA